MRAEYIAYKIIILLGGISFLSVPFAPVVSYSTAIFTLLVMSNYLIVFMRRFLTINAFISLLVIIASRSYTDELEHDLSHYHLVYKALANGNYNEIFGFSGGIEIGWPLVYLAISKINSDLSPISIAVINTSICILLLYIWLNKYALKNESARQAGVIAALVVVFASVQTFGYLQRQAIATVILLMAISASGKKSLVLVGISTLFHLTSLPLGILYLLLKKYSHKIKLWHLMTIFIALVTVKLNLGIVLSFLATVGADFPGVNKLNYYLIMASEFSFTSKRFAILIFPLAIMMLVFWNRTINNYWKIIALFSCLSYMVFLGVPLGPERLNFILLFGFGYFVYLYIYKLMPLTTIYVVIVYILLFVMEKINIFGNYIDPFWSRYPSFSFEPFYYLY